MMNNATRLAVIRHCCRRVNIQGNNGTSFFVSLLSPNQCYRRYLLSSANRFETFNWKQSRDKSLWERGKDVSKPSVALFFLTFSGLIGYYFYRIDQRTKDRQQKEKEKAEFDDKNKRKIGFFQAVDTKGHSVTDRTFRDKWLLLYFGFTNCPDICPEVLENLSSTVDRCKPVVELQPVFITVDPFRDSAEKIEKYLSDFHPNFIGLTGSADQMSKLFGTFGVYARANPADDDGDYIVDHTIITYLVSPDGRIMEMFTRYQDLDKVYDIIVKHVNKYKPVSDDKPYSAAFR
ncbi:protein SCO2 homolog, mitochondrial-like [Convolutriloba macropyga]|uniref:protein SCO2 homolog, mitochondrial-like n=1 Tax=Convolutriloba macropyga TaxID=536237 RepID=UPI003F520F3D